MDFLSGLAGLDLSMEDTNDSDTNIEITCPKLITHQEYFLFLLIPAVVFTIILSFTKKRFIKTGCCGGRPALVYPQDVIGRSNRVSYAAAFGSIAVLCGEVIFGGEYAIDYSGPVYLKVFVLLLSMLIYGVCYYPLFLSLALDSIPGYIVGIIYIWTITVINFARTFACGDQLEAMQIGILIIQGFPEFFCQVYLCFSLPVRLILRIRRRNIVTSKDVEEEARTCFSGLHVRKIFEKPEPPKPEPDTLKEKALVLIKSLPAKLLYFNVPKFRYSGRVLSVFSVAFIIMYMVTVQLFLAAISFFQMTTLFIGGAIEQIGLEPVEGEDESVANARIVVYLFSYINYALEGCFYTAVVCGFIAGAVSMLHSLATYRMVLLDMYKGKDVHLIPKEDQSHGSSLVGFMRYAGYQVAYIGWGYLVQILVLFAVSVAISTVVILFQLDLGEWFINKFHNLWPVLLTTLVVNLIQLLLARCVFLQRRGEVLALNNRRLFFIVVYFMFFYNIFLGLVSCLLRILKAIILGALFLPRLDHSTLPRRFQWFDPGFAAYCGFMYVESAHTNPIAITFIKILKIETLVTKEAAAGTQLETSVRTPKEDKYIPMSDIGVITDASLQKQKKARQARFRWQTAYTLIRNPELLVQRKFDILNSLELLGRMNKNVANNDIV